MANKLIKYIEIEEFKKVLKEEKDKKFKLAYVLGMGSGLRISEIVGLKEEISKCHNVPLNMVREKRNGRRIKIYSCSECGKELKTSEIRRGSDWKIPPLTKEQINLENHQIKILGKGEKERITQTSPWLNKTNIELLPLDIPRRTLQDRFTKLCKRVLGRDISFHTLRHGYGNYMVNDKSVPMPVVQSLMGHASVSTTGIYAKANPKKAVETAWESF